MPAVAALGPGPRDWTGAQLGREGWTLAQGLQGNLRRPGPTLAQGCPLGQRLRGPQAPLTVQRGQRLVVTVQDDGLGGGLGRGPCGLGRRLPPIGTVQPLDVELEVPVPVEAEGEGRRLRGGPTTRARQRLPACARPHRCPQRWHSKGFSLVWVSMWRRRSFLFLEAKLHWLHWWGRRLECCAMWACRWGGVRAPAGSGQVAPHGQGSQGPRPQARWIWEELGEKYEPDQGLALLGVEGKSHGLRREAAPKALSLLTLSSPL